MKYKMSDSHERPSFIEMNRRDAITPLHYEVCHELLTLPWKVFTLKDVDH